MTKQSILLSVIFAATASAPASALANNPDSFEIASDEFGDWLVSATTKIRWEYVIPGGERAPDGVPFYASSTCTARSDKIAFAMDDRLNAEWMQMSLPQFSTADGEIMPERSFDMYLDDRRFELGYGRFNPTKMTGFDYPAIYETTPGFRGYNAFRRAGEDRWIALNRLFDYLLDAETGHVSMTPLTQDLRGLENYDPSLNSSSLRLDIAGFQRAAEWCAETLQSPAATTLPPPKDNERVVVEAEPS